MAGRSMRTRREMMDCPIGFDLCGPVGQLEGVAPRRDQIIYEPIITHLSEERERRGFA
jgi:hypothetical protein